MGSESMTHVHDTRPLIQAATNTLGVAQRAGMIRRLNDDARRFARAGSMYVTQGVMALGTDRLVQVLRGVREFDSFSADNDPYDEHDMGVLDIAGERILWKIDYYDAERRYGSPDPANAAVTTRVLTIMLAAEY